MKNKYDAFLSHNSQDKPIVEQIAQWLEDEAKLSVWLDKWNLIPGDPWQEEIEKALDESQCCVVFLGPNEIGPWQNEEMRTALDEKVSKKTIRVVPVLLPGARRPKQESNLPRFLRRLTWVVFNHQWNEEDALHRLVCGIKGIHPGREAKKTEEDICPFRGLEVFREQDQNFFFGREAVVQRLIDKLNTSRFLAVLGPSGCGKSSVVQAGIIPHLREQALIILFTPRAQPIEELAFALRHCYPENKRPAIEQLINRLMEAGKSLHYIAREVLEGNGKKNLLVVIDQFEELFTQTSAEEERRAFIHEVLQAVEVINGPVSIILTMRSDFMGKCAFYPDLNTYVSEHFFQVEPMSLNGLRIAIEEPARLVEIDFETGLVNRILDDVEGSPGELPLLEHALLELYEMRNCAQITFQAYNEIGGIEGALVKRAESEFAKLDDDQKEILRKMFVLRLIQPGEGTEDTRRRAEKEELLAAGENSQIAEELLYQWTNARLLTITRDNLRQKYLVDVAHEALIRKWVRIQTWMAEDREAARQIGILRNTVREWKRLGENPDYLFRGARLVQMETFLKSHAEILTQTEIEFINAGTELHEKNEKEKEEIRLKEIQLRQNRIINRIIVITAIVSFFLALFAFFQKNRADIQRREATVHRLTVESMLILERDNTKAIRMAEAAYKMSLPHPPPMLTQALSTAAYSNFERPFYITKMQHEKEVLYAVFSPDSTKILTISNDKTAKLWDLRGKLLADLNLHTDDVRYAMFSPDGSKILTASRDDTAKLWDLRGKLLADLNLHTDDVRYAMFSPDGTKILTASDDKTARLWDLNGKLLTNLKQHTRGVSSAVFSPDGTKILTASWDNTAKLWDLKGQLLADLKNHTDDVTCAVFSPDGTKILTASHDHTAKLWDLKGNLLIDLDKHTDYIWYATFSPNGTRILTASRDKTAKLWDLKGKLLADLNKHTDYVRYAAFSPNGTRILTASRDKTAKLWDLSGNLLADLNQHRGGVYSAVFSPDGIKIITASDDKTAMVWYLSGELLANLNQQGGEVSSAVFSPDGTKVLTTAADTTPKLWDSNGNFLADLDQHTEMVTSAVFSPGGTKILTASYDNTAKLWDLKGNLLADLNQHTERVNSAVFSPDGTKILTASHDNTAKLWDLKGNLLTNLNQHTEGVHSAVFSPDGTKILTASNDNTAKLCDLKGNILADLNQHNGYVYRAVFSPEGTKILTESFFFWDLLDVPLEQSFESFIKLWDLRGNLLADLGMHQGFFEKNISVFSPNSAHLLTVPGIGFGSPKLWDLNGNVLAYLDQPSEVVNSAVFSPDGTKILTASNDNTAKLWNLKGNILADLNQHKGYVYSAVFSPDGTKILTASDDNTAKLWDLRGNLLADLNKHKGRVRRAVLSPDGSRILTVCFDGTIRIWYTSEAIMEWLKTAPIPKLTKEEKEKLGIADFDID